MATPAQIFVQQDNMDQQRRHALEDSGRQQTLEFNQGILNNPDAPEDQKLQARSNIAGLYPTPHHAPQFLLDLLHIKHRQANQPAAQAQKDAASTSHGNAVTNTPPVNGDGGSESAGPAAPSNPVEAVQGGAAPVMPTPAPPTAAPAAQVRQVAQAQTPQDALAQIRAYASPGQQANSLQQQLQDKMAQREKEIAETRGKYGVEEAHIRAGGNVSMQKLNAAAQALGEDDFASATPENKMAAIKSLHQANVTTSWKAVTDGNNVYAVDAHNPSAPRTLIGHKDDLTQHSEYKTMTVTNPDGSSSQTLVPVTVWSKKGSTAPLVETQQDAAPVSANTPQVPTAGVSTPPNGGNVSSTATPPQETGAPLSAKTPQVPNPGARQPGTKPNMPAVKNAPVSATPGLPKGSIPFGGKASQTLYKAAAANYEKQVPVLESSESSINSYLQGGAFTGPGDLALQHEFFTATQPSTGFRMTKVQQDILHDSQSLINKLRAAGANITGGTIYSPEQRQQIAKAALEAIAQKKKAYSQALEDSKNPQSMPKSSNTSSGPSGPKEGDTKVNSAGDKVKFHNGAWGPA